MQSRSALALPASCMGPPAPKKRRHQDDKVFPQLNVHPSQTSGFAWRQTEHLCASLKTYFVYIMSNRSKTLYTGITGNFIGRVRRHKLAMASQFTTKYKLDRLVYFERYEDVHKAIEREREFKRWLRTRKIASIVSINPAWRNLSLAWIEHHLF